MTWQLANAFHPDNLGPYLSAATRQASEASKPLKLTVENWKELAEAERAVPMSVKLERLLGYIGRKIDIPGDDSCQPDSNLDHPVCSAVKPRELNLYLEFLQREDLIHGPKNPRSNTPRQGYEPTIKGWQRLESIPPVGGEPGRCFVAMSFAPQLESAYRLAIEPAIRHCGFSPDCLKDDPTNKEIMDRVLTGIRRAHFVVADFTEHSPNVYYEAGFARGIGREVIGCCHKDHKENLAFDTRHLGHVIWNDETDLKAKLVESIQANVIPKR